MKAYLKNYRQSPRKVRLVADLIRGKNVEDAYNLLEHTDKLSTRAFLKLIQSAVSNATHNNGAREGDLYIKELRVDEGVTLHRFRPVSRGAAHALKKRTSNMFIELGVKNEKPSTKKSSNKKTESKKEKIVTKS